MTKLKLRQVSLKTLIFLFVHVGIATVAWQRYDNPPEVTWEEFNWKSVHENAFDNRLTIVCYEMEWTTSAYEFREKVNSKEFARIVRDHSAGCMKVTYYDHYTDPFFNPLFKKGMTYVVAFHSDGNHRVIYDSDQFLMDVRREIWALRNN